MSHPSEKLRRPDYQTSLLDLTRQSHQTKTNEQKLELLNALIELYPQIPSQDSRACQQARQAFLVNLENLPVPSVDKKFTRFLAEEVRAEDFASLGWKSPNQVSAYCELLYSLEQDDAAITERVNALIRDVLNQALQQYERSKELEKLFILLQYVPATPLQENDQLRRMRNRAYVYEMRRVQRHRRFLYGYLVIQVILIVVIFPILYINTENGYIQDQIQHATNVPLPQEQRRTISYPDGLYWSLITAASIGYGDVVPHTGVGKTLAAILGIMGVTTVGVIAGLILQWITPRQLD